MSSSSYTEAKYLKSHTPLDRSEKTFLYLIVIPKMFYVFYGLF